MSITSLSTLCALCRAQTSIQRQEKKIPLLHNRPFPLCPSGFMAWPLLQSSPDPELTHCLQCPLWRDPVFLPMSVQVRVLPGSLHTPCPLSISDPDPVAWTAPHLSIPSLLSPVHPSLREPRRWLEPAIKAVNGSKAHTHASLRTHSHSQHICRYKPADAGRNAHAQNQVRTLCFLFVSFVCLCARVCAFVCVCFSLTHTHTHNRLLRLI